MRHHAHYLTGTIEIPDDWEGTEVSRPRPASWWLTRAAAGGVGFASIAALTACADTETSGIDNADVTITSPAPATSLVPANASDPGALNIVTNIFTGLTRFRGATGAPVNAAAQKMETTDNVTWNVTLRKEMTFHDGTPVTSDSFIQAWNWAAYAPNQAVTRAYFAPIAGFDALSGPTPTADQLSGLTRIDDLTFTITLSAPNSQFPVLLATPSYAPLPASFFTDPAAFAEAPVGNGPYRLVATDGTGSALTTFGGYFTSSPSVDGVAFVPATPEADVRIVTPPATPSSGSDSDDAESLVVAPTAAVQSLTFPTYAPRFADPEIRLAFSTAVDREFIIAEVFGEQRLPATSWVSPVANGYRANACGSACTYNSETAQNALANAGGFDGDLVIAFVTDPATAVWVESVCRSITNTLAVPCRGEAVPDQATFDSRVASRGFDGPFVTTTASPIPTADAYLRPFATGSPANASGYSNPLFDAALGVAASSPAKEATGNFANAAKVLAKDVPAAPLWVATTGAETQPERVANASFTPLALIDLTTLTTWE